MFRKAVKLSDLGLLFFGGFLITGSGLFFCFVLFFGSCWSVQILFLVDSVWKILFF